MNTLIALAQLFILIGYVLYIVNRFGILPSISESTYRLDQKERYYFTMVLWAVAFLNYFQPMEIYGALASGMLMFTGVTVSFKSTGAHTNVVHYISAVTAIVVSVLGLVILYNFWHIPVLIVVISLLLGRNDNFIWWFEVVSFLSILGSYMLI